MAVRTETYGLSFDVTGRCAVCGRTVHGAMGEVRCFEHGGPDLPCSETDAWGTTVYFVFDEREPTACE